MNRLHLLLLALLVTQHECRRRNVPVILDSARRVWASFFPLFDTIDTSEMPLNTFFSPVGLHIIMALLSFGADENSKHQLRDVAQIPFSDISVGKAFKRIIKTLETEDLVEVNIGNGLFISNTTNLYAHYKALIRKNFGSEIILVDFEEHEDAIFLLNEWTKFETNDRITNIADSISPDTLFTVLSTVYFKAFWKVPFPFTPDNKLEFHNYDGSVQVIDFMEDVVALRSDESDVLGATVVELRYMDDFYSMILILPDPDLDVIEVQDRLIEGELIPMPTTAKNIHILLPKFKLVEEYDLKEGLQELGVLDIFDKDKANFRRMTRDPLYVDGIIQATFLDIDEEGTEAAGASLVAGLGSVRPHPPPTPPIDVIFDRPFLLSIIHLETGIPLFFGRVTKLGKVNRISRRGHKYYSIFK